MKYIFIAVLFISSKLSAQTIAMFDTSKVDSNTKLIGRYPQYDKAKTYKSWNFYIDSPEVIKKVLAELNVGMEVANSFENPSFSIALVRDFNETSSWTINPTMRSALNHGHTYKFDIEKIKKLSKEYPFDYTFKKVIFKSKDEYQTYVAKQRLIKTFLFDYSPQFKYEGSFEIRFPRNNVFSSPKAISEFLSPLIEKHVNKGEYSVTYILSGKNIEEDNQYTMTINGSKVLFDRLKLDNLKKKNWKPTVEDAWFFYKAD